MSRIARQEGKAIKDEPILKTSAVVAAIVALVGLLVAFGLDISDELQQQIAIAAVSIVPVVMALAGVLRQLVVSPETAAKLRDQAYETTPGQKKPDLPILPATTTPAEAAIAHGNVPQNQIAGSSRQYHDGN